MKPLVTGLFKHNAQQVTVGCHAKTDGSQRIAYVSRVTCSHRKLLVAVASSVAAVALVLGGIGAASAYISSQVDIGWYTADPDAATFTIADAGDFAGLAQLVNGTYDAEGDGTPDYQAIDFAGKDIHITDNFSFLTFDAGAFEPVGTSVHPFQGTLSGWDAANACAAPRTISFKLEVDGSDAGAVVEDLGLFGYVGSDGSISNIQLSNATEVKIQVTAADSKYIRNIGSLAGYCAGSISNCSSAAKVEIESAAALNRELPCAISNVGGLVGQCIGGLSGDSYSGSIELKCSSSAYEVQEGDELDVSAGRLIDVAENIGGVCGLFGDFDDKYTHGTIAGCSNSGAIVTELDGEPVWGERFKEWNFPEEGNVGGIVGFTFGSVSQCTNSGDMETCILLYGADSPSNPNWGRDTYSGADGAGGIVGNLRGETANGAADADGDWDYGFADDPISITDCTNTGHIHGYHAAAGIVGVAGTYTQVLRCSNTGDVDVYRWNKPSGAGIAGQSYGDVGYCYNMGTVTSVPGAGYYCAGIVGMSLMYWDANLKPLSPQTEIYSCFNAGVIAVNAGNGNWKQGGIVGQYDGYVHDNVLLKNTCYADRISNGEGQDYGSLGVNTVMTSDELRTNAALLALNTTCDVNGWDSYFTLVDANELNSQGFPVINTQVPEGDLGIYDLSTGTVVASCVQDAPYTGMESIPELTATYNGTTLVQDVDFRVLPQPGAMAYSGGERPYQATIVGVGAYAGEASDKVAYGIGAGDLSTCTVTIRNNKFNWENQPPTKDLISVYDPAGNLVSPDCWTFTAEGDSNGEFVNREYLHGGYKVTITPVPDSQGVLLYTGSLVGRYNILKVSIQAECYTLGITYDGATYYWDDDAGDWKNGIRPMFAYTGGSILPDVIDVQYLGRSLTKGTTFGENADFSLVYGNPNSSDNSTSAENANTEITDEDGLNRACVTVRYWNSGKQRNFTNFTNLLFDIVDSETTLPSFYCDDQPWTGEAVQPFAGSYKAQDSWTLTEGEDYQVVYENNMDCGYATFTVTGLGKYADSPVRTGRFAIYKGELPEFTCGDQLYTGSPIQPFAGSYTSGNLTLTEGVDYQITYSLNTAVGTAEFKVIGLGDYSGQVRRGSFQIVNADLPEFTCGDQLYTGSPIQPFAGSYTVGSLLLTEGVDYMVTYENNTEVGTASFVVTGQGNYEGQTREGTFSIVSSVTTSVLKFDINNDDKLSAADLTKMRLIIAARLLPTSDEEQEFWHWMMDFGYETGASGSGSFNATDLTHLRLRIAGRESLTYVELPGEYQHFLPE